MLYLLSELYYLIIRELSKVFLFKEQRVYQCGYWYRHCCTAAVYKGTVSHYHQLSQKVVTEVVQRISEYLPTDNQPADYLPADYLPADYLPADYLRFLDPA